MARLEDTIRAIIEDPTGNAVLILRRPSNKEHKHFLRNRFPQRGIKHIDRGTESREEFINSLLVGVEDVEIRQAPGEPFKQLSPDVENWKDKIPVNWKISACQRHFEEKTMLEGEDLEDDLSGKNSEGPSD